MNERASLPSLSDLIGQPIAHIDKRLSEILFAKDTHVLISGWCMKYMSELLGYFDYFRR